MKIKKIHFAISKLGKSLGKMLENSPSFLVYAVLLPCFLSAGRMSAQIFTTPFPFQDERLPLEYRVEDLLSRLTLEEKLSLMEHRQPAIPSLGVPAYSWWNEALHGVGRNGTATVWPMPIALAASFNTEMVYSIFSDVAVEACEKYAAARSSDTALALREPMDYTGLTFFTPNINILRDPRWGRGMETYGEDPYLTAMMGLQCVNGLQHPWDRWDLESLREPVLSSNKDSSEATKKMAGRAVDFLRGTFCYSETGESRAKCSKTLRGFSYSETGESRAKCSKTHRGFSYSETGESRAKCSKTLRGFSYSETPLATAACLKHLAVHSGPEGVRHEFDAAVSPRDLWTTYLPAFEYIVTHTDVQQVMCGYNRLNGVPCCTNRDLLLDILRNKWHYDGLVVTDCWALNDCWERDSVTPRHETHASAAAAAADAFGSEVDLECGSGLAALQEAVAAGYINEARINEHVRRILRTRMRLSLEDDREVPFSTYSPAAATAEGLVLLKNQAIKKDSRRIRATKRMAQEVERILPLKQNTRIYLAGPNASDTLMPLGNYNGQPQHTVSIHEGLEHYFTLVESPREAEVIVYAGGLTPQLEGEELPVEMEGFSHGDRTLLELPAAQRKELRKLRHTSRPVVLLLSSGGAIALHPKAMECDAIIECWYGGEAMGEAVGAALAGIYDCFGRLPVTFYQSTEQLPDFESYDMQGRTYRYLESKPLFPFGYGLNYDTHELSNLHYNADAKRVTGQVKSLSPHDTDKSSKAVVEVYLVRPNDPEGPHKSLVGFAKVPVLYGGVSSFSITLDDFWFRLFDEETQEMREASADDEYEIWVGFDSENLEKVH